MDNEQLLERLMDGVDTLTQDIREMSVSVSKVESTLNAAWLTVAAVIGLTTIATFVLTLLKVC